MFLSKVETTLVSVTCTIDDIYSCSCATDNCTDPLPQGIIHPIVVQCVAYLNKESVLKEEGLFRIPGDVAVIKQLRERFINGMGCHLCAHAIQS